MRILAKMIYKYKDCVKKYGSDYRIKKLLDDNTITKISEGYYSDTNYYSDQEYLSLKYPRAIFTLNSAFYYHGIVDEIPEKYNLATNRNDTKIKDKNVKQYFIDEKVFELGKTIIEHNGEKINIYNLERMLIEAVKNKSKMPYDYYKEIITYYRNHIKDLDIELLQSYIDKFSNSSIINKRIMEEVY